MLVKENMIYIKARQIPILSTLYLIYGKFDTS